MSPKGHKAREAKLKDRILEHLKNLEIAHKLMTHEPAETCEKAAQYRGLPLQFGGKTALLKSKHGFHLFCVAANLQFDNAKIRKLLGSQKLRFAREEEKEELLGVPRGAIPPLGHPITDLELYLDASIFENESVAFNIGVLTQSVVVSLEDFLKLTEFKRGDFSRQ